MAVHKPFHISIHIEKVAGEKKNPAANDLIKKEHPKCIPVS